MCVRASKQAAPLFAHSTHADSVRARACARIFQELSAIKFVNWSPDDDDDDDYDEQMGDKTANGAHDCRSLVSRIFALHCSKYIPCRLSTSVAVNLLNSMAPKLNGTKRTRIYCDIKHDLTRARAHVRVRKRQANSGLALCLMANVVVVATDGLQSFKRHTQQHTAQGDACLGQQTKLSQLALNLTRARARVLLTQTEKHRP